jgi:hypothetical protein
MAFGIRAWRSWYTISSLSAFATQMLATASFTQITLDSSLNLATSLPLRHAKRLGFSLLHSFTNLVFFFARLS